MVKSFAVTVVVCTEDIKVIEKEWGFHEISNGFLECFQGISKLFLEISRGLPGDFQGISRGGGSPVGFQGISSRIFRGFHWDF